MRLQLDAGEDAATVDVAAGGRLASLVAGGKERVVTVPPAGRDQPELYWGVFPMAPYAGRVRDATLRVGDRVVQLPRREGSQAMHGLVLDRHWEVVDAGGAGVHLRCRLPWEPGGSVSTRIALEPGRLTRVLEVEADDHAFPAWAGWHPWFQRPEDGDLRLTLDAGGVLETDEQQLPTGRILPVEGPTDLREGPVLGERRLDHVYPGVRWPAFLRWPDLTLRIDSTARAAVVFTPAHAVCVEPQTGWPDAAALAGRGLDSGVADVSPGNPLHITVVWTWSASGGQA